MLVTAGASIAESFAVIYRSAASTNNSISTKASQYIGQRPGLQRLMASLEEEQPQDTGAKRGRPRKQQDEADEDKPLLDYREKDVVLKEFAKMVERCEKESDKIAVLNAIANLRRMKQEAAVEDEKRVTFHIPLSYDRCEEFRQYLERYYTEKKPSMLLHLPMVNCAELMKSWAIL